MQVKDDYTSQVQVSIASAVCEVPAGGLLALARLLLFIVVTTEKAI